MNADTSNDRLRQKLTRELGQIATLLKDQDVVEISVNPDGAVWVERLGQAPVFDQKIARSQVVATLSTVAATLGTTIDADNPIVSGELLIDGSRIEGLFPPVVSAPTYSLRRRASKVFSLDDYVNCGVMSQDQRLVISTAVLNKKNILIVGGTSTGKTTLTNGIIQEITQLTPDDRLVIIEDTYEIQCAAANKVMLHANERVTMDKLLRSTLRLSPDRILVGEVRGGETLALLKAWSTGHPGGVATLHANDPKGALLRLEQLAAERSQSAHLIPHLIGEAVDMVIHIARTPAGRSIKEIAVVDGYDPSIREYQLTTL